MSNGTLCLSQISKLVGMHGACLHERAKARRTKTQKLSRGGQYKILLTPEQIKKIIHDRFNPLSGKVIYIGNLKGGVGKTTLAYLTIEVLSTLGLKTCAIDLDIQANLTRQFDGIKANPPVFADLVDKKLKIEDIIIKLSPTLDIIPSSLKNGLIQKTLSHETPKHYLTWFNSLCLSYLRSKYDVIVVDTPPSLTTLNSVFCLCLQSTDDLLIPACADEFSIMGIEMFLEDVKTIRESYKTNSEPKTSILINKFFQNQTNNIEMFAKISKAYPNLLSKNVIKDCAKIRETTTDKKHIGDATRKSELFDVLVTLLNEFNILKKVK